MEPPSSPQSIATPPSTSEDERIDIEVGREEDDDPCSDEEHLSSRERSRRVARCVEHQTELFHTNSSSIRSTQSQQPTDQSMIVRSISSISLSQGDSPGLRYWLDEIRRATDHGGNYKQRLDEATRVALASFTLFSVYIFPKNFFLEIAWIGNLFMLVNSQGNSLGSALQGFRSLSYSIVLVTCVCFPIAYLLDQSSTTVARILFPPIIFIVTFGIITCPFLTAPNAMLAVMYISLSSTVHPDSSIEWWQPLNWTVTYIVGLFTAIIFQILPYPNPAMSAINHDLERFVKDLTMFLYQAKRYSATVVKESPTEARAAIACMEMLQERLERTVTQLQTSLPAALTELRVWSAFRRFWSCCVLIGQDKLSWRDDILQRQKILVDWVQQTYDLMVPLKSVQIALTQRVLGEEHHIYDEALRKAKGIINDETEDSRSRLLDAMIASIAVSHAKARPIDRTRGLNKGGNKNEGQRNQTPLSDKEMCQEISSALEQSKADFHEAMKKASLVLMENCRLQEKGVNKPVFAYLTRRMVSFTAIFQFAKHMCDYLDEQEAKHSVTAKEDVQRKQPQNEEGKGVWNGITDQIMKLWRKKWNFHDRDSFRLALKTCIGMVLASLFFAVPYLYDVASPFALWPGLTIAGVNLSDTGSSFHKALVRIFEEGDLDLFHLGCSSHDTFDFAGSTIWNTFRWSLCVSRDQFISRHKSGYSQDPSNHSFHFLFFLSQDTRSCSSLPVWIIFYWCHAFWCLRRWGGWACTQADRTDISGSAYICLCGASFISKKQQAPGGEVSSPFFPTVQDFTKQAATCTRLLNTSSSKQDCESSDCEDEDPFELRSLTTIVHNLEGLASKLKKELKSGIDEPNFGLSLRLDAENFRGLTARIQSVQVQARLILQSIQEVIHCYKTKNHPIRKTKWPLMHARFLQDTALTTENSCERLLAVFPDGHLRPQSSNALESIIAASSFRMFQDVRLRIMVDWDSLYYESVEHVEGNVDPVAVISVSVATTYILEFCRYLQCTGKCVEGIARSFPPSK